VPLTFTAHRSNSRPLGSPTLEENRMRFPDGNHEGAKLAAPRYVTCCASEPSAFAVQISSCVGRTSPWASSFWYVSRSFPWGRDARQTIFLQSGEKNAPPS